ncbi:MAG: carbon storage regulator CsrA [Planctomycetes bacterium]|nr:carbon storage regulator CsrA [Planctomycetota bacterium]
MLVLSRQRDQTIMIGDDIELTVVDIRGDKVRIGITAPARIAVHRKEVYDAIKRENEQASCLGKRELTAVRPHATDPRGQHTKAPATRVHGRSADQRKESA